MVLFKRLLPLFFQLLALLLIGQAAWANDVTLRVDVRAQNDQVRVFVKNIGTGSADRIAATIELNGATYFPAPLPVLASNHTIQFTEKVVPPTAPGVYPLNVWVSYENEGEPAGIVAVATYTIGGSTELDVPCSDQHLYLQKSALVSVPNQGSTVRLIYPTTVRVDRLESTNDSSTTFRITYESPGLSGNSAVYTVYERNNGGQHQTKVCLSRLTLYRANESISLFSTRLLWALALLGCAGGLGWWIRIDRTSIWQISAARALYAMGTVSGLLAISRCAGKFGEILLNRSAAVSFPLDPYLHPALNGLLEGLMFTGGDYDNFFRYFADVLLLYFLFGNVFVLRYCIRPDPAREKTSQLMSWWIALFRGDRSGRAAAWANGAKVAVLATVVKAFYAPMLASWACSNALRLFGDGEWFAQETTAAVAGSVINGLIFIDVMIFAVGYFVELPRLKNEIRSVEPTFFGWFICLICYPPFFHITKHLIEIPLGKVVPAYTLSSHPIFHVLIVLLWAVYVWASIALGFRASNLTNRGTVAKGPYRYIRHPAYASKVSVWIVSAIALGTMPIPYAFFLAVIYTLRAWTEERHLGADPEYRAYQARVKWVAVPGVF